MNETAPATDTSGPSQQQPGKSSTALAIRIVLLVVLALLVIGLVYDYWVARPAHENAWVEIQAMLQSKNTDAGMVKITNKDVAEKFGRSPSTTYTDGRYTVEVYSWRTGLLVTSYPIYVYYEGEDPLRLALANPSEPIKDLNAFEDVKIPPIAADADTSPEPPADSGEPEPDGDSGEPEPDGDSGAPMPEPPADGTPTPADDAGEEPEPTPPGE